MIIRFTMNSENKIFNRENHKLFLNRIINGAFSKRSPLNSQINSIYIHGVYWVLCCLKLLKYRIHDEFPNIQIIKDILNRCESIYIFNSTILMGYSLNPFGSLGPTILSTLSGIKIKILLENKISQDEKSKIMNFIQSNLKLRNSNEAFFSNSNSQNNDIDIRFIYSALSSIYLLNMDGVNSVKENIPVPKILNTLKNLQNIDGGFGRRPKDESHAGYTFCAMASIALLQKFDRSIDISVINHDRLERWLLKRIIVPEDHEMIGESLCFNGRIGKRCDVCYSWWVIASIKIIESTFTGYNSIFSNKDDDTLIKIIFGIISHQNRDGGFQKMPFKTGNIDKTADPLHTFLSISASSILIKYLISRGGQKVLMFLESVGFLDSISEVDPITVLPIESGFIWKVVSISEFKWLGGDLETLYYNCPCGDIFWVKLSDLECATKNNEFEQFVILECESCSLKIKVKFCKESIQNLIK
ncbi:hypothetical protein FG379_002539 [Cryptosporidium bovis]|uniref:uncharacterized protein n=1 Tax=Cryptosporidium bovis TaxID=310047 RepID=UPI00351A26B8|nr:hypothetical protein FG379_002539 [Cryptosporidium bovis]